MNEELTVLVADDEPELAADILFGAAASLHMDDHVGGHMDAAWSEGRSALRDAGAGGASPDGGAGGAR